MNWNGPALIRSVIDEVGLGYEQEFSRNDGGLLKLVVRKR